MSANPYPDMLKTWMLNEGFECSNGGELPLYEHELLVDGVSLAEDYIIWMDVKIVLRTRQTLNYIITTLREMLTHARIKILFEKFIR